MSNIRTQLGKVIGKSLNSYYGRVKPVIDDLKFKEAYQGRIIDCMVGEIDDNYIETPETDSSIVKLENSVEGVVKIPTIKGKTILVDEEGNETDTPREGCKLVSVGEDEDNKLIILSKNKNLVNELIKKGINSTNGIISNSNTSFITNIISVDINKSYVVSGMSEDYRSFVAFYDKDMNYLKRTSGTIHRGQIVIKSSNGVNDTSQTTYKLPTDAKFIVFTHYSIDDSVMVDTLINTLNIQIEEGEVVTPYIEHKSNKTEILLKEPLREIPSGVNDEIINNKIIRRVGKVVIDGSQRLHIWNNSTGDTVNGYLYYNYLGLTNVKDYCKVYNNTLVSNKGGHIATEEGMRITAYIAFSINKEKLGISDVNDNINNAIIVTQWFKDNPTELLYELAEPIIEELPNSITLQGFDDTTMYIENSITPTVTYGYNALIPYKEELKTQKEEVEINTLDIENNIIPYLMDMEFNLMLMEDN